MGQSVESLPRWESNLAVRPLHRRDPAQVDICRGQLLLLLHLLIFVHSVEPAVIVTRIGFFVITSPFPLGSGRLSRRLQKQRGASTSTYPSMSDPSEPSPKSPASSSSSAFSGMISSSLPAGVCTGGELLCALSAGESLTFRVDLAGAESSDGVGLAAAAGELDASDMVRGEDLRDLVSGWCR